MRKNICTSRWFIERVSINLLKTQHNKTKNLNPKFKLNLVTNSKVPIYSSSKKISLDAYEDAREFDNSSLGFLLLLSVFNIVSYAKRIKEGGNKIK